MEVFYLSGLAFLAGFVDSVVGGGGLIQIPALFIFLPSRWTASVPLVFGTNKLSSICGTGMAVARYSRQVRINWSSILPAGLTAFGFSLLGAATVTVISSRLLKPMILVLLIIVAVYTYLKKDFGSSHAPRFAARHEKWLGMLVGVVIGFYDGFFGPGTGSFLMFIFIGWFGFDFLTATASAKVLNFATNLSAVSYFAATDHILYRYAVPMGLCNMAGAVAGTRMAMGKGNAFIRLFFLAVVGVMIVRFGFEVL
ncbi:MAG: TSUP family transporter [Candidatus Omnitrophica bacterium]|nr:TSUP family transporter [Candidatus Omnitrophota bacterium]